MDLHTSNRHFKLNIDRGRNFLQHFINNTFIGLLLTLLVLYIGVLGYHHLEHLDWVDSFLNAAMILGGMGPVNTLYTDAGKIFAGCYALFSGLAFIAIMAIILAPAVHHLIKRIHLEDKTDD